MSLKNVIEHSIQATSSEGAMEARRSRVRELEPAYKRVIIQSIDVAIFALPSMIFALDRLNMHSHGYNYVGSGVEARVYSDGSQVTKYVVGSDRLTTTERKALRDKKQEQFDQLQASMSSFVLDQTINTAPHVLRGDREYVQTLQPHVKFTHLLERTDLEGGMKIQGNDDLVLDGLSDFVDASWDFFGSTGMLPDINGPDNVVRVGNSVVLLDTQPIIGISPKSLELTQRQLGSITALLDKMS